MDIFSNKTINSLIKKGEFFITVINGKLEKNLSNTPKNTQLICDGNLGNAINRNFKKIKEEQINGSNPGYLLTIKSSKNEPACIYINNINTAQVSKKQTTHNRFVVEKNAAISIIEQTFFIDKEGLAKTHETISEWFIEENANLYYYGFGGQNNHINSTQTNAHFINQKQNSTCEFFTFYWGLGKIKNSIQAHLIEKNICCKLHSISLLKRNSFVSNDVTVTHHDSNCESSQNYKGIYDDESQGVFNGNVLVKKNAQKTNAFQNNNNILLSEYASIDSNPQLEIFADDVKCSHGSTTGQLDEAALFYLRSRGGSKPLANSILLQAFLANIVNNIKHVELKNSIILQLNKNLGIDQLD